MLELKRKSKEKDSTLKNSFDLFVSVFKLLFDILKHKFMELICRC